MKNSIPFFNRFAGLTARDNTSQQRELTALFTAGLSVFNKAISLVAVVLYVRWTLPYLGNDRFGIWMALTTFIAFASIFSDLGIASAIINRIASVKIQGDRKRLKSVTSSAFFFLLLFSLVFFSLFLLFQTRIVNLITGGTVIGAVQAESSQSLLVLIGVFLAGLPFVVAEKTLEGLQLMYISACCTMVGNVLSLVATFFAAHHQAGLPVLILSTLGVQVAVRIGFFAWFFCGRLSAYAPSYRLVTRREGSGLVKNGLLFFALNLCNILAFNFDNLLIAHNAGPAHVGQFAIMQKLTGISLVFWLYTSAFWPAYAEAHAKNDQQWLRQKTIFLLKLNTLLSALTGFVVVVLSGWVVSSWSKNLIAPPSFTMKLGFALNIIQVSLMGTLSLYFNAGPIRKHFYLFCTSAGVTFLAKCLLIRVDTIDYIMFIGLVPVLLLYLLPGYRVFRKLSAE